MNFKGFAFTSLLILAAKTSFASTFVQCNTCSSDSSYKNTATYVASGSGVAVTDILVGNFNTKTMNKYRVVNISSREPGVPDTVDITPISLDYQEQNKFDTAGYVRDQLIKLFKETRVPTSVANSVWDIPGTAYVLNDISDYYRNNSAIQTKISSFLASVGQIANVVTNVPITIEVSFEGDNSTALLQVTPVLGAPIPLKIIQLTDDDNNTVPLTKAEYENKEFRFSDPTAGEATLRDVALRFGYNLPSASSSGPGGGSVGGYYTSCVERGSGHHVCTLIRS